jgi:pimeloyl-ACP methyl ester carboxylesterase
VTVSAPRPALVCLHGLGLSSRLYDAAAPLLTDDFDVHALDLPGFGDEKAAEGSLLDASIALVERRIAALGSGPYLLVGHSMGGKVATLVASRASTGRSGVPAPAGVVLLAASPPAPEPMGDDARAEMLGFAAGDRIDADAARSFVDDNVASPLAPPLDALATGDVERSDPAAWRSWLTEGSRRDESCIGPLDLPAVVAAGAADGPLGEPAQRTLNLPHYPAGRLAVVEGAAHFIPLEQPEATARLIRSLLPAVQRL